MNLEKIRWAERWAKKFADAAKTFAAEMETERARMEAVNDPMGALIYQARASYRATAKDDHSKSGRATKSELERTYKLALALGFEGRFDAWEFIMRCGKRVSTEAPAVDSKIEP